MRERALLALALLAGCGGDEPEVRPQWLVTVDTDVPVPRFGDRLLIEVMSGSDTCAACRRVFDVSDPGAWPHSFGVEAGHDGVRLRLFRARDQQADGSAPPDAALELYAALPPAPEGVRRVRAPLHGECWGIPADVEGRTTCIDAGAFAALTLADDDGAPSAVGTWGRAADVDCGAEPAADERCVPGGAFLMGETKSIDASPVHVASVSPFFLDVDEVRVGDFRTYFRGRCASAGVCPPDPICAKGVPQCNNSITGDCPLFANLENTSHDALPMACLARSLAEGYCTSIGKRLPTEAEWEWAAKSGSEDRDLPWLSTHAPRCSEVVLARSHRTYGDAIVLGATRCTFPVNAASVPERALGTLDVSAFGQRDLGGGLAEWVSTGPAAYADPCWAAHDPACSPEMGLVARGGSWLDDLDRAGSAARQLFTGDATFSVGVGFRCARDPETSAPLRPAPPEPSEAPAVCNGELTELTQHPDAKAAASGVLSNTHLPGFVLDGDLATSWLSAPGVLPGADPGSAPWIDIYWPFPVTVDEIHIGANNKRFSDFRAAEILTYAELTGDAWLWRAQIALPVGSVDFVLPSAVSGVRRVRLRGITWQGDSPGIGELRVVGRCE